MDFTRKSQNWVVYKIISFWLLLVIFVGGMIYFCANSPKSISNRVHRIIQSDDTTKLSYLRTILTQKSENERVFFAQLDILDYISKKKDFESIPSFIEFYKNITGESGKITCIIALGRIPASGGVDFLISELHSNPDQRLKKIILDRLYKSLFQN